MKFCNTCGTQLADDVYTCTQCGSLQPQSMPYAPKVRTINVGMLVWAIINMVCCCLPFAIVAVVYAGKAPGAVTDEEEAALNKKALIWNIVASSAGVLLLIGYFVLIFIMSVSESGSLFAFYN